jgi:tetratricopeptide (TPR) repeat protein
VRIETGTAGVYEAVPIWLDEQFFAPRDDSGGWQPKPEPVGADAPEEPPSSDNAAMAQSFLKQGSLSAREGNFEKALEAYSEAIRIDPTLFDAYSLRSRLWEEQSEWGKAIDDCTEEIRLSVERGYYDAIRLHRRRAELWQKTRNIEKALEDYAEAIKILDVCAPALKALEDHAASARLRPEDAWLLLDRGDLWFAAGNMDKACRDFEVALRSAPREAEPCTRVAWFLATASDAKFRDGKRARELATRAFALSGWSDWHSLESLAAACAEVGQFELATQWQARALDLVGRAKVDERDPSLIDAVTKKDAIKNGQTRLALYKSGKPYREVAIGTHP